MASYEADLALATACLRGDPAALATLDGELLAGAVRNLAGQGFSESTLTEATQLARLRLLLPGEEGGPPALASYQGEGPLRRFVQVVLGHAAVGLTRRVRTRPLEEADLVQALGLVDLEGLIGRGQEREIVRTAVHQAIASLSPRDRALLRFHLLDRRTHEEIATIYGVSRGTVTRWLEETRGRLALEVRSQVSRALGPSALDELALSQLDLSLSRVLGGA